jgi:hypothetical protein
VIYLYLDRVQERFGRRKSRQPAELPATAGV